MLELISRNRFINWDRKSISICEHSTKAAELKYNFYLKPMNDRDKKVLIIDDHRLVAEGLALILSQTSPDLIISVSNSVRSVLQDTKVLVEQDLILVDLDMPAIDGYAFLSALKERKIVVPVIVVSATESKRDIERALSEGAQGFIPKNAPSVEFVKGIKAVSDGQLFVPEHLTGSIDWKNIFDQEKGNNELDAIRPRQIEVLKLIKSGYSNVDIATVLNLSESTVKTHVTTLFKALKVKNRTSCVQEAIRMGLID